LTKFSLLRQYDFLPQIITSCAHVIWILSSHTGLSPCWKAREETFTACHERQNVPFARASICTHVPRDAARVIRYFRSRFECQEKEKERERKKERKDRGGKLRRDGFNNPPFDETPAGGPRSCNPVSRVALLSRVNAFREEVGGEGEGRPALYRPVTKVMSDRNRARPAFHT